MFRPKFLVGSLIATGVVAAVLSAPQTATPQSAKARTQPAAHLIVVNLVDRPGRKVPFAFEPAAFTAMRGDTLRFVQLANTMHNVHFKTQPSGSRLGSAAVSPYLTAKGQAYTVVVDSRFGVGRYEIVCDPHEMIGMKAILTVQAPLVK